MDKQYCAALVAKQIANGRKATRERGANPAHLAVKGTS